MLNAFPWNSESKWPNDLQGQSQWLPFSIPDKRTPSFILAANLVILDEIQGKLLHWQTKFTRILSQNGLEGQGQWPPFSISAESKLECMLGANLVIQAEICNGLLHRKAKFPRILSQNGQNDLEGQGEWPLFSIPRVSQGANLVIPFQICDELLCRQGKVYKQTDGWTDRQMGTMTIPHSAWKAKG